MEFERTGQEGYVESYDPRFSVSFLDLGETSDLLPCYVRDSAFYDGFSPAIGIFGTNYMDITNNVIHNTVGSGKTKIGGIIYVNTYLVCIDSPGGIHLCYFYNQRGVLWVYS